MWTLDELARALDARPEAQQEEWRIESLGGTEPCLLLSSSAHGDAELYITVDEDQMLMSALLFPVNAVRDSAELNEELLRTHKLLPLSTVGITEVPDAGAWYELFGSLSNRSTLDDVVLEIETLLANFLQLAETYAERVDLDND